MCQIDLTVDFKGSLIANSRSFKAWQSSADVLNQHYRSNSEMTEHEAFEVDGTKNDFSVM